MRKEIAAKPGVMAAQRKLLESREPNVHDQVWKVILNRGEGTIIDFATFEREHFEQALHDHTKVVLKF